MSEDLTHWALALAVTVILGGTLAFCAVLNDDCRARGGVLVKTPLGGLECVRSVE